ncbi:low-density lipoprotein receptor-related protein 8-like [Denticeps clupeoides]|uniref:low-density lipoprotein receptor-related protein 8-like n=1 Tax=Denticeps clupeoides TaxID=299321 RepID=UPI0010A3BB0C|nr:low-density lipoprotein receptor-related protein 8-like [Denticeps clupeoides]
MCKNEVCVPELLWCDGQNDCGDNSDEVGCGPCAESNVRCPEGICLSANEHCDGTAQCRDGRDEPVTCGKKCSIANGSCSHICVDQPWGAQCKCPAGFTLSANGASCKDFDECSMAFGPCMQICLNTPGSFSCSCVDGFELKAEGACYARGNRSKILTVKDGLIGLVNLATGSFQGLNRIVRDPVALTYDLSQNAVFWADDLGQIYMAEGLRTTILFTGQSGLNSLACDWLSGLLYWGNAKTQSIFVGAPDGSRAMAPVIVKDCNPLDLVLLPNIRSLFWLNKGLKRQMSIETAGMDGSRRTTLAIVSTEAPRSLTLDVGAKRLYWISDFKMTIETIKWDGTGRHTFWNVFRSGSPKALAVFEGLLYWTDKQHLWQTTPNKPKQSSLIQTGSLPLMTLHHELQQPQGPPSPCAKSRCQLCLPSLDASSGYICACPKGLFPLPDGSCQYFRIVYATARRMYTLEFRKDGPAKTLLFSTLEDMESFDIYWTRGAIVFTNGTGHVKVKWLNQERFDLIPTPDPGIATLNMVQMLHPPD